MKNLYSSEIRDKYQDQKWMAKSRGIQFKLTIEQWVAWWEDKLGPDWFKKRGCKSGQYVMARKRDRGPYAIWNIECVTANQNHADMKRYGTYVYGDRVGGAKLTNAQVRVIFLCDPVDECLIKEKYPVSSLDIAQIKRRRVWVEITKGLGDAKLKGRSKGASHPMATLTENQVRGIFLAKGSDSQIARKLGRRVNLIRSIKIGSSWRSITSSLGPPRKVITRGPYNKR